MKNTLFLVVLLIVAGSCHAQLSDIQSSPESVMKEVFRAADTRDFSNLHLLCPPDNSNDGDTQQYICDAESASEKTKDEYVSYFKEAKINGEITYGKSSNGNKKAAVPFWFNHPSGESRSNETMNLVEIEGKWYLSSF